MNLSENKELKLASHLIIFSFLLGVLIIGKSILIPFSWSLLISLASVNMMEKVENRTKLPRSLLIFIYILVILAIIFLIIYFFYIEITYIISDLDTINRKISEKIHDLSVWLASIGVHIPDHLDKAYLKDAVSKNTSSIFSFISGFGLNIWNILLVIFYMFFLLYYRDLIPLFFTRKYKDEQRVEEKRKNILKSIKVIRGYLVGLVLITLISGILNYLVFLIFGLPYGLFFAFFLAILNLITYIGNPIGLVVILLFSLISFDSALTTLFIFIALFLANFLQDNVIRPWLLGDKLKLNAFTVFLAVILGGAIWGVSGMILFIPIIGIIKVVLENNEKLAPYAVFISDIPSSIIARPENGIDDYFMVDKPVKSRDESKE